MAFSDNAFLAKLREHADRARRLFSNPRKPERERVVVRAFLRCVGETFEDSEIVASSEEAIEVRYRDAQHVADVMEPYTPSQPMSFDDAAQLVADRLSAKTARYGAAACARL